MNKKKWDTFLLLLFPVLVACSAFFLHYQYFYGILFFFVAPSIFLSFKVPGKIKKASLFSLFSVLLFIPTDYIAHLTKAWVVPHSILPFRLFRYVTIENILWFFHVYFLILMYEYLFESKKEQNSFTKRTKYFAYISGGFFLLFLFFFIVTPHLLYIPYWYLVFGTTLLLIPLVLEKIKYPKMLKKFLSIGSYFFYFAFMFEITALHNGWWQFPGREYVGWISIFGVSFPLEEFFFWFIAFSASALSYYEFFLDDEK